MRSLALVVLTCLAGAAGLSGQSRILTEVDTTLVTVGDRITLTVTVEHAPDRRVVWPDSLDLAPFEVQAARVTPPMSSGDPTRSVAVLTLAAFQLGELEIPSFEVRVSDPAGGVEVLPTDRFGVDVVSVGTDEGGDIRDIRGPLGIPLSTLRVALLGLVLLLVVALVVWLWRRYRRRSSPGGPAVALPARPPHEIALEALARLERSPLLQRGQVKDYHIELSDILRRYVEGRFGVPALEMTTREVLDGLRRAASDDEFTRGLTDFLNQCDVVKFAKGEPGDEASRRALALGRRLVEASVPPPPSVADTHPGPGVSVEREPATVGQEAS